MRQKDCSRLTSYRTGEEQFKQDERHFQKSVRLARLPFDEINSSGFQSSVV
jgi:hypothetical protein